MQNEKDLNCNKKKKEKISFCFGLHKFLYAIWVILISHRLVARYSFQHRQTGREGGGGRPFFSKIKRRPLHKSGILAERRRKSSLRRVPAFRLKRLDSPPRISRFISASLQTGLFIIVRWTGPPASIEKLPSTQINNAANYRTSSRGSPGINGCRSQDIPRGQPAPRILICLIEMFVKA